MRIGLIDVDGTGRFPNIALMKISAWHKSQGDSVDYPTRERAIQAAQDSAEYYTLVSGGEWQKTEDGAIRWWTDEEGNRCRRIYKVNNNQ